MQRKLIGLLVLLCLINSVQIVKMIATEDRGGIYVKDLDFKLNHDKCIILI